MSRTMLAALTLRGPGGVRARRRSDVASADSLSRDLQLAPVDTTATLNDQPSRRYRRRRLRRRADAGPGSQPAAPKPKPKPKPAAPAARGSGSGGPAGARAGARRPGGARPRAPSLAATTDAEIRSRQEQGRRRGHRDGREPTSRTPPARSVIPAGSKVTLQVTAIKESENKGDTTGTLTLKPTSVAINGQTQPLAASISGVQDELQGRKTGRGRHRQGRRRDRPRAPIVGRVIGGSTKGADHRRHHRRRGRRPARGRDQGSRRGAAGRARG